MKKILIVEDEELILNLLQKKLTNEGYKILAARDGIEGLKELKKANSKPDLILLDLVMPRMGGFEMMEEMVKEKELKTIPVIIISNSGQPVEIDKAQRLGVKDWLIKTKFEPQQVIEKIEKLIGK